MYYSKLRLKKFKNEIDLSRFKDQFKTFQKRISLGYLNKTAMQLLFSYEDN